MRRVEEPGKHQGAPFTARWWWWLASSPRRWLRFGVVQRWRRWWWWVASPSPVQEEAPEASGDDAAASPHNDVLAATVLNGSSPAHLPAPGANLAASLAGVESSASTPSPPLLQEGAPESSDHCTAASTRSDFLATAVLNASSPAPLPAVGDNLAASLAGVESSASTTSPSPLQEGASEASEHGAAASPHIDVLAAAVLNASSPCHLQGGPEASGHGVAASQHTAPTSPSPPDSCDGAIISLEEEEEEVEEEEEEEEVVVVEQELEEDDDDDDPDKKTYTIYMSHVAETPKHSIVCLMCFLEKGEPKPIRKSTVEDHCKARHNTSGIKCEKTGCMVRAKYKGDIGKHKKYCHDLKPGWWKKPPRPDGA